MGWRLNTILSPLTRLIVMIKYTMEERRKLSRFLLPLLKAQLFFEEKKECWQKCTIININRKGMGIKFHTHEKINVGSTIHLETSIPTEQEPTTVKGVLKWFEPLGEDDYFGGIEFTMLSNQGGDYRWNIFLAQFPPED